jgi:aminopeptidase-like protein
MSLKEAIIECNREDLGRELHGFARELFPICRSITGDGLRQTLSAIGKRIALKITEVRTGTTVLDWTIPKEWSIRDAYIKTADGKRIVDFRKTNLHVLNYSSPVRAKMSLSELRPHLFSIPEHPDWIPYRTSYYKENWGFCLAHRQFLELQEGEYEVCIDSSLSDGNLTYGECLVPGESSHEILISCHVCHPSLANDNLSGLSVATFLAQELSRKTLRYSYRFLFIPGTIGAIAWLAKNQEQASRIKHGLVLTCVGDRGFFHYKRSRREIATIDRAVEHVLKHLCPSATILPFSPYGYDERQYCSPGFNLPVGCLMRSVWGTFPEYHTSGDNLDFLDPISMAESLQVCVSVFDLLENDRKYKNLSPFGEPQLGRRGLYPSTGGTIPERELNARLWTLNLSDGHHSLLDIAERSGLPFALIRESADILLDGGLLVPSGSE